MKNIFKKLLYLIIAVLIIASPLAVTSCDAIETDMMPVTDDTYNIGSPLLRWHDISYAGVLYGGYVSVIDILATGDIVTLGGDIITAGGTIAGLDIEAGNDLDVAGSFYLDGSIIKYDAANLGGYWHEYNVDTFSISKGASGATLIVPDAITLGGYELDNITDFLYFTTHVEGDYDGVTDGILELIFEVNIDNTGGLVTDTVDITATTYHKLLGELNCTVDLHTGSVVVGQSDQNELFVMVILMNDIVAGQNISVRLNLNTALSEVDNIVLNYIEFKYQTYSPAAEVH